MHHRAISTSSLFSLRLGIVKERMILPFSVGTPHMISHPALIRKGVFKNFFIFFRRADNVNARLLYLLSALYIYMMRACAYTKVFANCQARVRGIFLSEKFYTIPHPTYVPRAPSFHSTKNPRYAIHAQFNYRGRECHTSGLICGKNSILGGLEARRARSLYLDEWLLG